MRELEKRWKTFGSLSTARLAKVFCQPGYFLDLEKALKAGSTIELLLSGLNLQESHPAAKGQAYRKVYFSVSLPLCVFMP